jgi:hypothetical protein
MPAEFGVKKLTRKAVVPRILGLLVLYFAVFIALVTIQFGKTETRRTGPERKIFNPADFVIDRAGSAQAFNETLGHWRDQRFTYWRQTAPLHNDEDTIIAYNEESIQRGNYRTSQASSPAGFRSGGQRTYQSSVYLGGMVQALRSFTAAERETVNRVSRLIDEKSSELLRESHVFDFLAIRSLTDQFTDGLEFIQSIDAEALTLDLCPGLFEGYADTTKWRPETDNPFERLIERACQLIAGGLQKDAARGLVLVYRDGAAGSEFNLRLGKALWNWAEDDEDWAALGRSLALSVLSLADDSGTVPPALVQSENGEASEAPGERISAARLYRILNPGEYYPRAAEIVLGTDGVWTWTAAPAVSAMRNSEMLDISVSFPANETHYMIIRGLRPFARLQLYNIDFRSDPQFERYDSSGWVYYPQDQILVVKMKHRVTVEHIRIIFRNESGPEVRSEDQNRSSVTPNADVETLES